MAPDWQNIVSNLGPRLENYFCASFAPEQAADLTQETLLRLVAKVRSGECHAQDDRSTANYAFGIAHYVRLESIKAIVRYPRAVEDTDQYISPNTSSEHGYLEAERAQLLRRAIAKLPDAEQQIILLLIDKDLSLQTIADILAMPLNTVKNYIHRAKARLRDSLEEMRHGT